MDILKYENHYRDKGFKTIVGIDEAGRGCLAGRVYVAGVIFKKDQEDDRWT